MTKGIGDMKKAHNRELSFNTETHDFTHAAEDIDPTGMSPRGKIMRLLGVCLLVVLLLFLVAPRGSENTALAGSQLNDHNFLPVVTANYDAPRMVSCNRSFGSGGLPPGTHDTIIAGRPATVIVPEGYDEQRPTFLAFYLHGDEGGYDYHQSPQNIVNSRINQNSWIYVAPQAPPASDGVHSWSGDNIEHGSANAQLIVDVIDHMFDHYDVCQNVLFGSGVSGGSIFFDGYFYPARGVDYASAAIFMDIQCGSSGPDQDAWFIENNGFYERLQTMAQNPELVRNHELFYTVGTEDFLYDNVMEGYAFYTDLGFNVGIKEIEGAGHCAYGTAQEAADYWTNRRGTISVPGARDTPIRVPTGIIAGTVSNGTEPLPGVRVAALYWENGGLESTLGAYTDANGHYELSKLEDRAYIVNFIDLSGEYYGEYYDDVWDLRQATPIEIYGGSAWTNIDAVLALK